jgi:hypothetical protein
LHSNSFCSGSTTYYHYTLLSFTSTGSRKSSWIRTLHGIGPRLGTALLLSSSPSRRHARHTDLQQSGLLRSQVRPLNRVLRSIKNLTIRRGIDAMARAHAASVSTLKSLDFLISQLRLALRQHHPDQRTLPTTRNWEGCYRHASVRVRKNTYTRDASMLGDKQTLQRQGITGNVQLASSRIASPDYTGALF